jgi:ribosome-binding factor A
MSSRRLLKAAEAIREAVSTAVLLELDDPRIENVTVTRVEVSPDMQLAKVYVSIMGDAAMESRSLRGLQNAAGYLQQKVSEQIEMRYTPKLKFVLDKGVKNALTVSRILDEVLAEDRASEGQGSETQTRPPGAAAPERSAGASSGPPGRSPGDEDRDADHD